MSKETFQWTDALIEEYITHRVNMAQYGTNSHHMSIELFKKAKMLNKKDYEVTEIINKHGGKITKAIDSLSWEDYCGLKSFDGFKINAVKRLSDEKVFEVGEEVKWAHHEPFKIIKFRIGLMEEMFSVDSADLSYDINKLTKLPPPKEQSKPEQPKKERIEINGLHDHGDGVSANSGEPYRTYSFNSPKVIPTFKHKYIKEAIEKEINDEKDELLYDGIFAFLKGLKYTTEELREAEEKAFIESRLTNPFLGFKHNSFKDYLKSKQ